MPSCKQCETKYSLWSARGDGLCKQCGTKADEIKKQEAEKKEAERKQKVYEDSTNNIALIVKSMTSDEPLCYTFINRGITEKKGGGLLGVVVGGALGGIGGAMIGNALNPSSCNYSGQLGIMLVTQSQVLTAFFAAPFNSADGNISSEHLELFRSQLDAKTVVRKAFNIRQTQLAQGKLICGSEEFFFQKSALYVNGTVYALPDTTDIRNAIAQNGSLVTPAQFIDKLQRMENPVPEEQFVEIQKDDKYIAELFRAIVTHSDRDALVQNFAYLIPSAKEVLEASIRSKGASSGTAKVKLVLFATLAIAGVIGGFVAEDFIAFLSVVLAIIMTILSITSAVNLKRAIWCRDIL